MVQTEEFKLLRRLALASLGRNILHFQRVEAQLKQLVRFCDFAVPLREGDNQSIERKQELRKTTMGTLVNELHTRLYSAPAEPEVERSIKEAFVRVQFRVDADPDFVAQQKKMLSDLVLERNTLIHQDLAEFDPDSEESCRKWIIRLDEQNERIVAVHKELQQLLNFPSEAAQHLFESLNHELSNRAVPRET